MCEGLLGNTSRAGLDRDGLVSPPAYPLNVIIIGKLWWTEAGGLAVFFYCTWKIRAAFGSSVQSAMCPSPESVSRLY
jgi:hypothetical protein